MNRVNLSPRSAAPSTCVDPRQWTDVPVGPQLSVSISIPAHGILLTRPAGFARSADAAHYFKLVDEIAADCFRDLECYVYVADWHQLEGATRRARTHIIAHLQAQRRIAALIIFGASTFPKFSLNLALKFYRPSYPVRLAENEDHALAIAQAALSQRSTRNRPPAAAEAAASRRLPTPTPAHAETASRSADIVLARSPFSGLEGRAVLIAQNAICFQAGDLGHDRSQTLAAIAQWRRAAVRNLPAPAPARWSEIWQWRGRRGVLTQALREAATQADPRLAGLIVVTPSRLDTLALAWRRRRQRGGVPLLTVRDIRDALRAAQSLTVMEPVADPAPPDAKVVMRADWQFDLGGYAGELGTIANRVIYTRVRGYLEKRHIPAATAMQERVFAHLSPNPGDYWFIADVGAVSGGSPAARRAYVGYMRQWYASHPFRGYLFVGARGMTRAGINLARFTVPFKVHIVDDLAAAMAIVWGTIPPHEAMPSLKRRVDAGPDVSPAIQVEDLLAYLAAIEWDTPQSPAKRPAFDSRHPLRQVFDAIDLIHSDVQILFKAREESEQARQALAQRLARAQKMEAIGLLAGGVAHDLNNVLAGVVTLPELILLDLPHDSPLRNGIGAVRDAGLQAAAIVQDLLALARRSTAEMQVVNLNRILDGHLASAHHAQWRQTHPALTITTRPDPHLGNIRGSEAHLLKLLQNLVQNAAEAQPRGGRIAIATQNLLLEAPHDGLEAIPAGNYAVLAVADQGAALSPADRLRLFEPFYTKKVMGRGGTGLGMAVVWGTAKDHEAFVDVADTSDGGTAVRIFFPLTADSEVQERSSVQPDDWHGRGEMVLVVDDEVRQREIASGLLTRLGYRVATAQSGAEALHYLQSQDAALVLLDMVMAPGMDGLDTLQAIREHKPNQKVIIISGFAENERVRTAQRLGVSDFILKPYTLERLGRALQTALQA